VHLPNRGADERPVIVTVTARLGPHEHGAAQMVGAGEPSEDRTTAADDGQAECMRSASQLAEEVLTVAKSYYV
jgi:hypothetical protein